MFLGSPGDWRKPRPTICCRRTLDRVGRASTMQSMDGMSVPSVRTPASCEKGHAARPQSRACYSNGVHAADAASGPGSRTTVDQHRQLLPAEPVQDGRTVVLVGVAVDALGMHAGPLESGHQGADVRLVHGKYERPVPVFWRRQAQSGIGHRTP